MTDPNAFPPADLLIRKARIVWPGSEHDGKLLDISLKDGFVEEIGEDLQDDGGRRVFESENLHLSPGWMDMNTTVPDPGKEEREDLSSGMMAAVQGGYTRALLMPSTEPPIDHRGAIEDLRARSRGFPFNVGPVGCISKKREGNDIAELYDMKRSGAAAFSDGRAPVTDAGLLINALYYSKSFDGRILLYPDDPTISRYGVMHEGDLSMRLGMKGVPSMSEQVAVDRALHLLRYADAKIHFSTLSTREALSSVRKAKEEGLQVTCDVSAHHLFFDEERLKGFSSLFKVMPPLRDRSHVEALLEAVADGTVDHVSSLHEPLAEEDKRVEFDVARFGIPGLETTFGAARKVLKDRSELEGLVHSLSKRPREILGMDLPPLTKGCELEATLFDPDASWVCKKEDLRSKAYRSPYEGEELLGRPLGVVHNGLFHSTLGDDG